MKAETTLSVLELQAALFADPSLLATEKFFRVLHRLQQVAHFRLSAEILVTARSRPRFLLVAPSGQRSTLDNLLSAYCPDFTLQDCKDYDWSKDQDTSLVHFNFQKSPQESLPDNRRPQDYDLLAYLLSGLLDLQESEQIVYQIVMQPTDFENKIYTKSGNTPLKISWGMLRIAGRAATGALSILGSPESSARLPDKSEQPLFRVDLRLAVSSPSPKRLIAYRTRVCSVLSLFDDFRGQNLTSAAADKPCHWHAFTQRAFLKGVKSLSLSPPELAHLYHLPDSNALPMVYAPRFWHRSLPTAKEDVESECQVTLGENIYRQRVSSVGLSADQRRRHVYVVGGTGSGKTTLLKRQVLADLEEGRGLAVIDPHGDLATDILAQLPQKRQGDLIYFNPMNQESRLGLNLLSLPPNLEGFALAQAKDLRTEALISVLRKVFKVERDDIGHRVEYVLRNTIHTSFSVMEPNLFTLFRLLNDRAYNHSVVRYLKDPYLKMFWQQEIARAGGMQRVKMQAGVTSKIGRFLFSQSVKESFNATSEECLNFSDILNNRQVLICNFSKGLLGEDASQLFCATVLAQIQLAALEQAVRPPTDRPDFYLYVDEFQHFATSSFSEMLAEARKYGLHLIMAQQSLQQQSDSRLSEAILANVGTIVVFRTASPADLRLLEPLMSPFVRAKDLVNLPSYHFYVKKSSPIAYPPVSGVTKVI